MIHLVVLDSGQKFDKSHEGSPAGGRRYKKSDGARLIVKSWLLIMKLSFFLYDIKGRRDATGPWKGNLIAAN